MMDTRYLLSLFGSLTLILGVFAPLIRIPLVGSINYYQNGQGDGVVILVIAIVALIATFARQFRLIPLLGIGALGMTAFTFIKVQRGFGEARASVEADLANNPFRGLADAAMNAIQMEWGWAVLAIGAILLLAGGAAPSKSSSSFAA